MADQVATVTLTIRPPGRDLEISQRADLSVPLAMTDAELADEIRAKMNQALEQLLRTDRRLRRGR